MFASNRLTLHPHYNPSEPLRRNPFLFPSSNRPSTRRVSAALRPAPHPRRNALRQKLLSREKLPPTDAQVRETPDDPPEQQPIPDEDVAVPTDSLRWSELHDWVQQYNDDNELWGIGTDPIFTVFRNPRGDVVRVSVDEGEIVRRNRIGDGEERDVGERISRAKALAGDIVSGEYVVPKNSSVVRFIEEGSEGSSILRVKEPPRLSPRFVFAAGCVLAVFWIVMEVWRWGAGEELTSREKEMLRRKLKARAQREMAAAKGSIEVVEEEVVLPARNLQRPELDKEELRKDLLKVGVEGEVSVGMSGSGQFLGYGDDFENKVLEIRDMARKVREDEKRDLGDDGHRSDSEGRGVDKQLENDELLQLGESSIVESLEFLEEPSVSSVKVEEGLREMGDENGIRETIKLDVSTTEDEARDTSKDDLSSSTVVATKPRIIRSVKKAREYLSRKGKKRSRNSITPRALGSVDTFDESNEQGSDSINGRIGALDCENSDLSREVEIKKTEPLFEEPDSREVESKKTAPLFEEPDLVLLSKNTLVQTQEVKKKRNGSSVNRMDSGSVGTSDESNEQGRACIDGRIGALDCESSDISKEVENKKTEPLFGDPVLIPLSKNTLVQMHEVPSITERQNVSQPDFTGKMSAESQVDNLDIRNNESVNTEEAISSRKPSTLVDDSSYQEEKIKNLDIDGEFLESIQTEDIAEEEIVMEYDVHPVVDFTEKLALEKDDTNLCSPLSVGINEDGTELQEKHNTSSCEETSAHLPDKKNHSHDSKQIDKKKWFEENFHEFEPLIERIGKGFRENYAMAKEQAREHNMANVHISELAFVSGDDEIEWMKDEKLKEIVFKVRENELAGKDPFFSMSVDDKKAFFAGLEKKAERINSKLSVLHEWIHSRVENLDYGADGISLYDSPEKIIPRWKSPVMDRYPEFLNNSVQSQKAHSSGNKDKAGTSNGNEEKLVNSSNGASPSFLVDDVKKKPQSGTTASSRTLIEGSDGSSRAGKKGGKEHWEYTKKWSRDFLEIYNAETDPEVKSALRDMGKDLNKWITDKEVEEAASLMDRIPKKKREFIQKKLDKLKNEMEMFGPQAVVSKYKEYSEEKEEDYLWWLDLKFVLCIELYTVENGTQKVGFYTLEMAPDLELDPKQFHVIAFEDPGDAKNFCYIMQAHLEMLGNGSAFVVSQPPKDAFREAKANGFHVTVIRSGQLKLNVDQRLEEVEEEMVEIGSKMYHDKIMQERSVDTGALMKGLFASERS